MNESPSEFVRGEGEGERGELDAAEEALKLFSSRVSSSVASS